MKRNLAAFIMVALLASPLGCTSMSKTQQGALSGGVIGAGAGAGIAALAGANASGIGVAALVAGGVGALAGGIIGHNK